MRVFRLSLVDDRSSILEWEIMESFSFETEPEAKAFKDGLSMGLDKGRVDHCCAILESEAKDYKIKNIFAVEMRPRLKALGLDFFMTYLSDDFTTFHIPDYKMSQALGVIERTIEDYDDAVRKLAE